MGIIKNQKINNIRTLSILGIPVYQVEKQKTSKVQKFLGGIVTAHKTFAEGCIAKEIKVLGLPVRQFTQIGNLRTYSFFNHKYNEYNLGNVFYKKYKKLFDKYDDIYIMHANIGESVFFLRLAKAYFEKNASKKPLLVGLQNYHKDLVELLCADIPIVIIKRIKVSLYMDEFVANGNKTFRLMFSKRHFDSVEDNIRDKENPTIHFKDHVLNYMGLKDSDFEVNKINISEDIKKSLKSKVNKIGLNLDNFVIFTPEANTCEDYEFEFWQDMKTKYESQGTDVFCNVMKKENKEKFKNFKQCDLSLGEIFELTKHAKELIGLRSGLLDLLVLTNTPMKVIYTKAKNRASFNPLSTEEIIEGFNMKEYKNVEEFNMNNITKQELLEKF